MLCKFQIPVCQRTFLSQDKHPSFFIDDWSLIGEPATEMDVMDFAKVSSGLNLGLKKAMASDLVGLRWRPLFRSSRGLSGCKIQSQRPDVPVWKNLCRYRAECHQRIGKWYRVVAIRLIRVYDVCYRWYEENKEEGAKDRALGHTCVHGSARWRWRVNFNKRWAIC